MANLETIEKLDLQKDNYFDVIAQSMGQGLFKVEQMD